MLRWCWPGVGGPRVKHFATRFCTSEGARGPRTGGQAQQSPFPPHLEPGPLLCPSGPVGGGLTAGVGERVREASTSRAHQILSLAVRVRRGPRARSQGSESGSRRTMVASCPHPLGPWLGLRRLSEASWSEAIISLCGRKRWRDQPRRSIPVIAGGFYEPVMGSESSQMSVLLSQFGDLLMGEGRVLGARSSDLAAGRLLRCGWRCPVSRQPRQAERAWTSGRPSAARWGRGQWP